jgi:hypothetical protein
MNARLSNVSVQRAESGSKPHLDPLFLVDLKGVLVLGNHMSTLLALICSQMDGEEGVWLRLLR